MQESRSLPFFKKMFLSKAPHSPIWWSGKKRKRQKINLPSLFFNFYLKPILRQWWIKDSSALARPRRCMMYAAIICWFTKWPSVMRQGWVEPGAYITVSGITPWPWAWPTSCRGATAFFPLPFLSFITSLHPCYLHILTLAPMPLNICVFLNNSWLFLGM